jgi:hypothetical protein
MRAIHAELGDLNAEAVEVAEKIQANSEELLSGILGRNHPP